MDEADLIKKRVGGRDRRAGRDVRQLRGGPAELPGEARVVPAQGPAHRVVEYGGVRAPQRMSFSYRLVSSDMRPADLNSCYMNPLGDVRSE
jgi:hypothetical protein